MEIFIVLIIFIIAWSIILKELEKKLKEKYKQDYNNLVKNNEVNNEINIIEETRKDYKYKVNNLMTFRELWFFKRLKEFLKDDPEINIFTKIRLADIITMWNCESYSERMWLFRKISQKHIDFIITDTNGKVKCLIELDDFTHNREKVKENDNFKNEVFENLGIPLLRFKIWETWDFSIIKEKWI